jgi:hypothetical protein
MSLLLVYAPVAPAASPAAVGKIQTKGRAEVNGPANALSLAAILGLAYSASAGEPVQHSE